LSFAGAFLTLPEEAGSLEVYVTIDTRWEDVDKLLARNQRSANERRQHAVQQILEQRYAFPTPQYASYRAHANIPDVTMAVQIGEEQVAPDIVVVERLKTGDTRLVMTAAVATEELVNEAEAKRAWSRYAALPDQAFYVYVPAGFGVRAKKLCKDLGIKVYKFRTWRTTPRGFEIKDIS
jgi:hypothetical protein